MAIHADIGLSQPAASTTTHRLDAISLDANSTIVLREVMVLGSPETTNALAAVLAAAPASTAFGLVVRALPVSVFQSTAGDLNVTVAGYVAPSTTITIRQSTAADLNVTVAGYVAPSTTVTVNGNVSSNSSVYLPVRLSNGTAFISPATDYSDGSTASNLAGPTLTFDNGTNATMRAVSITRGFPVNIVEGSAAGSTLVTIRQSTAAELLVTVYQSTAAALQVTARQATSSGGAVEGSTLSPPISAIGLHVRQVPSSVQSITAVVTSSNSTVVLPIVSSVAGQLVKVCAYFVGCSTSGNVSTLVFMSSLVGDLWAVTLSSGAWGANLAQTPPHYIFKTVAQSALNCRIESASTAITARVSLSYMQEP